MVHTILAEIITTFYFVTIFAFTTKISPPEHFHCNAAATGFCLFVREHAKDFALQSDCFVMSTTLIVPERIFCKGLFL